MFAEVRSRLTRRRRSYFTSVSKARSGAPSMFVQTRSLIA